jgi:hypothetical protein
LGVAFLLKGVNREWSIVNKRPTSNATFELKTPEPSITPTQPDNSYRLLVAGQPKNFELGTGV